MSGLDFADLLWEKIEFEDQEEYDEYVPGDGDFNTYAMLDLLGCAPDLEALQGKKYEEG